MTDQPSTQERCPTCGSDVRAMHFEGCQIGQPADPWHKQPSSTQERCPSCGRTNAELDAAVKNNWRTGCTDPWHGSQDVEGVEAGGNPATPSTTQEVEKCPTCGRSVDDLFSCGGPAHKARPLPTTQEAETCPTCGEPETIDHTEFESLGWMRRSGDPDANGWVACKPTTQEPDPNRVGDEWQRFMQPATQEAEKALETLRSAHRGLWKAVRDRKAPGIIGGYDQAFEDARRSLRTQLERNLCVHCSRHPKGHLEVQALREQLEQAHSGNAVMMLKQALDRSIAERAKLSEEKAELEHLLANEKARASMLVARIKQLADELELGERSTDG